MYRPYSIGTEVLFMITVINHGTQSNVQLACIPLVTMTNSLNLKKRIVLALEWKGQVTSYAPGLWQIRSRTSEGCPRHVCQSHSAAIDGVCS